MTWSFQEAREHLHRSAQLQAGAEQEIRDAAAAAAEAERTYRVALHQRGLTLRASGVAATAWENIAKGEPDIADLRYRRDVADGVLAAAKAASFRRAADRRDTLLLAQWSMRAEGDDGGRMEVSWTGMEVAA